MKQIRTLGSIELHIDYQQSINYATLLNGGKVIDEISIKNIGGEGLDRLCVDIGGFYIPAFHASIGKILPDEELKVPGVDMLPDLARLLTLNEAVYTEFKVTVSSQGHEVASFRFPLTIQAWNHWIADKERYQEVASFVMPHHPYVARIIEKATGFLRASSINSTFSGYNVLYYEDVMCQIQSIWQALLSENLNYLIGPSNYIDSGQRVFTPEIIARNRHGNCLDLSLLLCSCLERIGLSTCLVFVPEHVVVGVWMAPGHCLSGSVTTAVTDIIDYATRQNPTLLLIESTDMCHSATLDEAVTSVINLLEHTPVELAVDIVNARKEGVRSLPVNVTALPEHPDNEIKGCLAAANEPSRRQGWERKLLDLTLRNVMLNLTTGKNIVPVWERDVASVVAHIKANTLSELVGQPDKDNSNLLKDLYRAARTALEENGANNLFVSVGTLRWFDVNDPRPHIAPLLFIPVSIVRKKAMTYEIRLREDEAMVNVTLLEMLRQMFGVTFPEFGQLPLEEDGFPDWQKVFAIFAAHINEINKRQPDGRQWELPVQSYIGIFSFTKFLMWHDVHHHPDVIDRHPVLRGLIDNRYCQTEHPSESSFSTHAIEGDPRIMLPIDYDSSQLEAVGKCHWGESFVLHGPPGTGKSQTITNMIADALYSGKRVLFVAEKKAALDVVRSRLNAIGLEPYCLELHSNKADKRSFFDQVQNSGIHKMGAHAGAGGPSTEYTLTDETLTAAEQHLNDITVAIHSKGQNGLSLYDCVNRLLTTSYEALALSFNDVKHLLPEQMEELCAEFRSLDIVSEILGYHPSKSDLVGLYPCENTAANQTAVTEVLSAMPDAIAKARKKAESVINRWFTRRSAEEILRNSEPWRQLLSLSTIDMNKCVDIATFENSVKKWMGAIGELRRWYHFSEHASKISKYDLTKALDFYLHGKSGSESADAVRGAYYRAHAYHAIDNNSHLRGFSGRLHEDTVARYCSHAAKFQELRRSELVRKMEHNILNEHLSSEQEKQLAILSRRLQTNGRGVALRKVISDSENILCKLFPCMLMSPLSVAQYLAMKPYMFDLVIFDEASQMETPDAVGSIARGNHLVVVGDPLQLPPTRFFMSQTSTGEEVEESEDSNSILEDCIAIGLPSRYLSRHYRSRHESLIAFSNCHFYENRLLTFPSCNDSERKVSLINPSGVYDHGKTRTNRIEAEAVVKHVTDLLEQSDTVPSIGIVAFSKAQSNLIEDILNTKLLRNKALQKKLDNATEPLFIKNLETVQGDERDIIIFSIGYGPDKDGNVSLNFGPLNQSGGERRLNVAVSRAREEMVAFSSLLPHHIPTEGIIAKGVAALRDFLSYAIDGQIQQTAAPGSDCEIIIENIANKLRDKGLEVTTKVGRSSFKVDIAVVDNQNPTNYRLGILLDGRDYNTLPTVRDREITVPSVLRSLGWKLHRIWTIDWLENPDNVIHNVLAQISPIRSSEGFITRNDNKHNINTLQN